MEKHAIKNEYTKLDEIIGQNDSYFTIHEKRIRSPKYWQNKRKKSNRIKNLRIF